MKNDSHFNLFCLFIEDAVTEVDKDEALVFGVLGEPILLPIEELALSVEQAPGISRLVQLFLIIVVDCLELSQKHLFSLLVDYKHVVWLLIEDDA